MVCSKLVDGSGLAGAMEWW